MPWRTPGPRHATRSEGGEAIHPGRRHVRGSVQPGGMSARAGPYLAGATRLGLAAERCVVIEDAPAGVEAGKKAGMRVIGIAANHTPEALLESGADLVIDRLMRLRVRETAHGGAFIIGG